MPGTGEQVLDWRLEQLVALGVPPKEATELAEAGGPYVVHEARDLLAKGCPPELVRSILE